MDESSRESSFKEVAYTLLEQMDVSKVIFCKLWIGVPICRKGMPNLFVHLP